MTGTYDFSLVIASYIVAVIASFSAIYFSMRVRNMVGGNKRLWQAAGAVSLGAGIWSMHFVGMSAYQMPMNMTMSFDFWLTAISLFVAICASALGLWAISQKKVSALQLASCALIMGMGVFAMHYCGMYAMKMNPAIQYNTLIVIISGVIAVAACGAAMLICRNIERVPARYNLWVRLAAALVMGIAVCGMHYTGMAAVSFPMGSEAATTNALQGNWMGTPTAVAASIFLLVVFYIAYQDYKETQRQKLEEKAKTEAITKVAFSDKVTGLPNRTSLEAHLESLINAPGAHNQSFAVVFVELSDFRAIGQSHGDPVAQTYAADFAALIKPVLPEGTYLARYNTNGFVGVVDNLSPEQLTKAAPLWAERLAKDAEAASTTGLPIRFGIGFSHYPQSGTLARLLVRQAQVIKVKKKPKAKPGTAVS